MKTKMLIIKTFVCIGLCINFYASNAQSYYYPGQIIKDVGNNRYLIQNYGAFKGDSLGYILQRDYNGNLSYFVKKLTNPLGIVILDTVLYVANDSTYILGFGLKSGKEVFSLHIPGIGQLCCITTDKNRFLYVTDYYGTKLYKVDVLNKSFNEFCSLGFTNSSGIDYDKKNNRLIFITQTSSSKIYEVSLADSSLRMIYDTGLGDCDGLIIDKYGYIYTGSWNTGALYRITIEGGYSKTPIITGLGHPVYSYIDSIDNTIAIPCWDYNKVVFQKLSYPTSVKQSSKLNDLLIYPNPSNTGYFNLKLDGYSVKNFELFNTQGQFIDEFSGDVKDIFIKDNGTYFLECNTLNAGKITKIIIR